MNSRRTFLKQTGVLAASMALAPSLGFIPVEKKQLGLQLYTLRDILPKDVKGTIAKIAKAGYNQVEVFGYNDNDKFWGLDAKKFATLLKQNGLSAPSGHYDIDNYFTKGNSNDLKKYLEVANTLDSEYIVVPYLSDELRKTADDYKKTAEKFNNAALICKNAGLKLAYHNHEFEFTKFGNTNGYDILLSYTDKNLVDFELDLYWTAYAGKNPIQLFKENPDRFKLWHVKDMDKKNRNLNCEIGKGIINFKDIFAQAKLAGAKYYMVEQETNYQPNEITSIKTSAANIKKLWY